MRKLLITIYILITCSANLFSQWSNDPNNNLVIGYGLNPELCSDSAGGCYITYEAGYLQNYICIELISTVTDHGVIK